MVENTVRMVNFHCQKYSIYRTWIKTFILHIINWLVRLVKLITLTIILDKFYNFLIILYYYYVLSISPSLGGHKWFTDHGLPACSWSVNIFSRLLNFETLLPFHDIWKTMGMFIKALCTPTTYYMLAKVISYSNFLEA